MGLMEKIRRIEEDLRRTQVNKKTEHHIALLRARLAKLKRELEEEQSRHKGSSIGYDVKRHGDASVVMIGLPSVGKSTLLNKLTSASSKIGSYQFTTVGVVPGMMEYKGARIQILDLPGIIEGASSGRGLGKRVLAVARNADLILFVLDVFQPNVRELLVRELGNIGIRVDQKPPDIRVEKTNSGGIVVSSSKHIDLSDKLIKDILHVYGIRNARIIINDDITEEQLIDALDGNRAYPKSLTVINKIDLVTPQFMKELNQMYPYNMIPISAEKGINIDLLKERIFHVLDFIRVYMRRDGVIDFDEPLVLRKGATILDVCNSIHRGIRDEFRYALVWGKSVKFPGQRVGIEHTLVDGDIVTIAS